MAPIVLPRLNVVVRSKESSIALYLLYLLQLLHLFYLLL